MPHQCTNCGYVFPDGSKEMLSGCPDCGGNKFQFHPDEVPDRPLDDEPPERGGSSLAGAVGRAANTVRDFVHDDPTSASANFDADGNRATLSEEDPSPGVANGSTNANGSTRANDSASGVEPTGTRTDAPEHTSGDVPPREDRAQADARSTVVDADELPDPSEGRVIEPESDDRPDLADIRAELNDQFESIRIVAPGEYELNLMELYDRDEYIIALQENGRYVIEVPDRWRDPDDG